ARLQRLVEVLTGGRQIGWDGGQARCDRLQPQLEGSEVAREEEEDAGADLVGRLGHAGRQVHVLEAEASEADEVPGQVQVEPVAAAGELAFELLQKLLELARAGEGGVGKSVVVLVDAG